ncbi:MAG TPA: hypothetical protein V6D28_02100 [Leptolyngbyaceae cyanobacterium]
MQLPPLQLSSDFQFFVSGDVTIDPSATIASGVVITADTNSRIIIGAGVCIGMGSILEVREGTLEIEAGVILGTNVLVFGQGKIGANTCIGSATTIFQSSIEAKQVVPPGSLIGDRSRRVPETPAPKTVDRSKSATASGKNQTAMPTIRILPYTSKTQEKSIPANDRPVSTPKPNPPTSAPPPQPASEPPVNLNQPESLEDNPVQFYGQVHLNRLLLTLFPHNQTLKRPHQDGNAD